MLFFFPALAFASGLAATVTITHLLKAGEGIICMDDVYGGGTPPLREGFLLWNPTSRINRSNSVFCLFLKGTNRYFQRVAAEVGLDVTLTDFTKPELLKAALKPNTKVGQWKQEQSLSALCNDTFWTTVAKLECVWLLPLSSGAAVMTTPLPVSPLL